MEKFKMNLDREQVSREQIQGYRNFNQLKKDFELIKKPIWKTPWFWGAGGVASTTILVTIYLLTQSKNVTHEINYTQANLFQPTTLIDQEKTESETVTIQEELVTEYRKETKEQGDSKTKTSMPNQESSSDKTISSTPEKNEESSGNRPVIRLDIVEEEFPELAKLSGASLEVLKGSRFDPSWFEQTWDDVELISLAENKFVLKFSSGKELNKLYVRKL